MTPSARLQATLELLEAIAAAARPADALTASYFRARRFIGSKDRAAVSERLYAVLRHQARLDWWLAKLGAEASPRARLLAWLALGEHIAVNVISELFSGDKYAPLALTDKEHVFLQHMPYAALAHPAMPEDVRAECPPDLVMILRQTYGQAFLSEMQAMLEPAPLDLRVNILRATRDDMLRELRLMGLRVEVCPLSPWGLRVLERPSLADLPMLKNGLVEIQDEGSQLVAKVVDAKPGDRVVDFCAGAGGKTLAMAATMQNKGRIIACDIIEKRLKRSLERFRRAGLNNIETRVLTSERDPWVKKHKGGFDKVLLDAPCSGSGTWRRNPDARWRGWGVGLEALTITQAEILSSAARLVRSGGRLIYATCSLLPQENQDQIASFLIANSDFTLRPCGLNGEDFLSLSPARHNTDGFFAAEMVRT